MLFLTLHCSFLAEKLLPAGARGGGGKWAGDALRLWTRHAGALLALGAAAITVLYTTIEEYEHFLIPYLVTTVAAFALLFRRVRRCAQPHVRACGLCGCVLARRRTRSRCSPCRFFNRARLFCWFVCVCFAQVRRDGRRGGGVVRREAHVPRLAQAARVLAPRRRPRDVPRVRVHRGPSRISRSIFTHWSC